MNFARKFRPSKISWYPARTWNINITKGKTKQERGSRNAIAKYLNQAIDRIPVDSKRFTAHSIFVATSRYFNPCLEWAHVRRIQLRGRRPLFSQWTQSCCISYSVASAHTALEPKLDPAMARARIQSGPDSGRERNAFASCLSKD